MRASTQEGAAVAAPSPGDGSARTTRDDVLARLEEGISALTSSERWLSWLRAQSRFHTYSFSNALLLELQRPGCTRVAGYRTWQKLGRQVRRGERGLAVLAPILRRRPRETEDVDGDSREDRHVAPRVATFTVAWVWDVEQTEGEALPEVCSRLAGDDPEGAFEQLRAVAGGRGYRVEDADLPGETNGECSPPHRLIRIRRGLAPAQRAKTLAHEIAHALLHEGGYAGTPRPVAELEAESVAFVVLSRFGVDSGSYSFGYVATWAGGGDEARIALRASAQRIQRAAAEVIGAMDGGGAPAQPDEA